MRHRTALKTGRTTPPPVQPASRGVFNDYVEMVDRLSAGYIRIPRVRLAPRLP
jgi:hypothetical protein